jgi:hypothetical protein
VKEGPSFLERLFSVDNIYVNWTARGKVSSVKTKGIADHAMLTQLWLTFNQHSYSEEFL